MDSSKDSILIFSLKVSLQLELKASALLIWGFMTRSLANITDVLDDLLQQYILESYSNLQYLLSL